MKLVKVLLRHFVFACVLGYFSDAMCQTAAVKTARVATPAAGFRERNAANFNWFIGAQVSGITGVENQSESLRATGLGLNIKMEKFFGKRFSYTVAAGFDRFMGTYTYTLYTGSLKDTTIKRFTIAPFMGGLKYYFHDNFYLSVEFGPALKSSRGTRTKLAMSPAAGMLFPLKNTGSVDLALRFTHIVKGYGLLESNTLQNGGYSYLSLRIAYGF